MYVCMYVVTPKQNTTGIADKAPPDPKKAAKWLRTGGSEIFDA